MPGNGGLAGKRPGGRAPRSGSSSRSGSSAGSRQGLSNAPKKDIVSEWQRQAQQEKDALNNNNKASNGSSEHVANNKPLDENKASGNIGGKNKNVPDDNKRDTKSNSEPKSNTDNNNNNKVQNNKNDDTQSQNNGIEEPISNDSIVIDDSSLDDGQYPISYGYELGYDPDYDDEYIDFSDDLYDDSVYGSVNDYAPSKRATTPQRHKKNPENTKNSAKDIPDDNDENASDDLPEPHVASGSLTGDKGKNATKKPSDPSKTSDSANASSKSGEEPAKGLAGDVANIASDIAKKKVNASSLPKPVKDIANDTIPKVANKAAKSLPKIGGKGKDGKLGKGGLKGDNKAPLKGALRAGRMMTVGLPLIVPVLLVLLLVLFIGGCVASFSSSGDGVGSGGEIEETHGVFVPTVNVNATISANSNSDSSSSSGSSFDGDWCYFNQETPNWDTSADGGYGISNWQQGCGVVSYAMVLASYSGDSKYTPTWCVQNGLAQAFSGGAMVMESQMVNYVNDHQDVFHLKAEGAGEATGWKNDWDRVKRVTAAGGCVMISSNSIGTNSGIHYVVITKVENGTVTFKNPWGGKEETCTEDFATNQATYDIGGNITKSIWFEKI